METSAKQPINVDEAFYSVVREIRKYNKVCDSPWAWWNFEGPYIRILTGTERYPASGWIEDWACPRGALG